MLITYPDSNNISVCAACEESVVRGCGARERRQSLGDTKSARNFPRSLLKTAQKRCNSNDANSNSEIVTGELRAKLLSSRQDGPTHSRTSRAAGVDSAGGSGGPDCGTRGRRRGLIGLRADTQPRKRRRCGGRRRDQRAWQRCPWAVTGPGRASRRRAERSSRRGRLAGGPPPASTSSSPAQRGRQYGARNTSDATSNTTRSHACVKPRPADAGRGLPTQSGGRV